MDAAHRPEYAVLRLLLTCSAALGAPWLRGAEPGAPLPKGHVWYETGFEGAEALRDWRGAVRLEPGWQSASALALENRGASGARSVAAQLSLSAQAMRGYAVYCTARVKAEGVSAPPQSWNGIKLMLAIRGPSGEAWPQAPVESGSFDWRRATLWARIPDDATSVTLHLGLEEVTGKVWFDDVRVSVARPPRAKQPAPAAGPPWTGHSLGRLRGTMVSSDIDAASLRLLGSVWNANVVRWQLTRRGGSAPGGPSDDLAAYDAWLESELARLDRALPDCERNGLRVVLDLHSPPGGRRTSGGYFGSDGGLFTSRRCQEHFVEVWRRLAARYRHARTIWAYDLANEPVEDLVEEDCDDWQDLAERAARAIRALDPERTLIVEPANWGGPEGLRTLVPLSVSNVVYSVHMYLPHAFTHQGVYGPGAPVPYPGEIQGELWDRQRLERALQPVIAFQQTYNVHVYIGEFSAIRWAPGACRYLEDVIDVCEAHGWDWTYHAFREWQGWSVEHSEERQNTAPAAVPTDRERLLRSWFAKNRK